MKREVTKKNNRKALTLILILLGAMTITAAPGDLDLSFGNGGTVSTLIMNIGHHEQPSSILVQPDGKILVSGQIDDYGALVSFFLARYNPTGTLDTSFGENGKIIDPGGEGEFVGADIALQPDGKIIAVGIKGDNSSWVVAVNRYNSNGTLDISFGTGGKVVTTIGNGVDYVTGIALQPDGKIVVVGHEFDSGTVVVVRYNPGGSLDNSFGVGGLVTTAIGGSVQVHDVLVQPDGKIVAVGSIESSESNSDFAVVRYNPDGSLDDAFGTGGKVITSILQYDNAFAAVLQPDGKIVAAGSGYSTGAATTIVRYNANGSIDRGFAANGIFTTEWSFFWGTHIALQPDGKIVAFGRGTVPVGGSEFAIARLNPNGSLDAGFGINGRSVTPISANGCCSYASAGTIQSDGKILAVGSAGYEPYEITIARYRGDSKVLVAGRVTTPDGRGLRNATVSLTDSLGVRRTATTSSFGLFTFDNVRAGEEYVIGVASKRYRFAPRTLTVNENLTDVDLVGLE